MSVSDFLKDLPTRNRDNFTKLHLGEGGRGREPRPQPQASSSAVARHRATIYVPTKDYPSEQVREREQIKKKKKTKKCLDLTAYMYVLQHDACHVT